MSKSSFNALVEAKKQRDGLETEKKPQTVIKVAEKKIPRAPDNNDATISQNEASSEPIVITKAEKRETVRRSYRVYETHDKAIKVMSKFMGQGTEEEIVLNIFSYFFENNPEGNKAVKMVEILKQN